MIDHIRLQNYRSFLDAEVDLAPFTLVVGANGAGKTNLLRAFMDCEPAVQSFLGRDVKISGKTHPLPPHFNGNSQGSLIGFRQEDIVQTCDQRFERRSSEAPGTVGLFRLAPDKISDSETVVANAFVHSDGAGTTQCLESLKNGDQESVFDAAELALNSYVPEIEKLSFATVQEGKKQMQVREQGIRQPVPASELSEGTRLIIALLAIILQPVKPPVILLEDIDRGMHPRVFEQMVKLMQRIAREQDVQIIATTHNPYLVDCFQDEPEAVVIVEKKDGASTLATLAQKLEGLDYDKVNAADMPLGNLWFSGFVGGVPDFLRPAQR